MDAIIYQKKTNPFFNNNIDNYKNYSKYDIK